MIIHMQFNSIAELFGADDPSQRYYLAQDIPHKSIFGAGDSSQKYYLAQATSRTKVLFGACFPSQQYYLAQVSLLTRVLFGASDLAQKSLSVFNGLLKLHWIRLSHNFRTQILPSSFPFWRFSALISEGDHEPSFNSPQSQRVVTYNGIANSAQNFPTSPTDMVFRSAPNSKFSYHPHQHKFSYSFLYFYTSCMTSL